MVAEGEEGGKRRDARERRVLARDVCRRRAAEEEGLHLQPYVIGAATVCGRGCNPMWSGLQPYEIGAATVRGRGCNPM